MHKITYKLPRTAAERTRPIEAERESAALRIVEREGACCIIVFAS